MRFFYFLLAYVSAYASDYTWSTLHASTSDPEVLKRTVSDYRENFPCLDCREHFEWLVSTHPFPLEYVRTPADARVWTWLTHNLVNIRLNKSWESFDIMAECTEEHFQ